LESNASSNAEVLKIFALNILVCFGKEEFFKVLQAKIRNTQIEFEDLDEEYISLSELEGIIQSIK